MASQFALKLGRHSVSVALTSKTSSDQNPEEVKPCIVKLKEKAQKSGFLKKLSGKGILSSGTWRERYCVLVKSHVYFFASEQTSGKPASILNLGDYDSCIEAPTRISKKVSNVFVISASERGIFDSHSAIYFAADTQAEMKRWMEAITDVMGQIGSGSSTTANGNVEKTEPKNSENENIQQQPDERSTPEVMKNRARGGPQLRRLARKNESQSPKSHHSGRSGPEKRDEDSDDDIQVTVKGQSKQKQGCENRQEPIERNGDGGSLKSYRRPQTCDPVTACRISQRKLMSSPGAWSETRKSILSRMVDKPAPKTSSMTYCYSSSSEESLNGHEKANKLRGQTRVDLKKSVTVSRAAASAGVRNYCVTPPPPVVRRIRPDVPISRTPRASRDLDSQDMIPFMPELCISARRASSGSSLSTIKAEQLNQPLDFSSLQRSGKRSQGSGGGGHGSTMKPYGNHFKGSSSATASPLLSVYNSNRVRSSSRCRSIQSSCRPEEANNSRNGETRASMELFDTFHTLKEDLGQFAFQLRQLDMDMNSMRQDVGSVQENIATVRGSLDSTRERVGRLTNEVLSVERQIGAVVKEITGARQETSKILEEAEAAKATHEQLREEANNLIDFLRQMSSRHSSEGKKRFSFSAVDDLIYSEATMPPAKSNIRNHDNGNNKRAGNGTVEFIMDGEGQDSGNELLDDDHHHSEISLLQES